MIQPNVGRVRDWFAKHPNVIRDPQGPREDSGFTSRADPGRCAAAARALWAQRWRRPAPGRLRRPAAASWASRRLLQLNRFRGSQRPSHHTSTPLNAPHHPPRRDLVAQLYNYVHKHHGDRTRVMASGLRNTQGGPPPPPPLLPLLPLLPLPLAMAVAHQPARPAACTPLPALPLPRPLTLARPCANPAHRPAAPPRRPSLAPSPCRRAGPGRLRLPCAVAQAAGRAGRRAHRPGLQRRNDGGVGRLWRGHRAAAVARHGGPERGAQVPAGAARARLRLRPAARLPVRLRGCTAAWLASRALPRAPAGAVGARRCPLKPARPSPHPSCPQVTQQLFEEQLGLAGGQLLKGALEGLVADYEAIIPFFRRASFGSD